jgi:hypothetical protein
LCEPAYRRALRAGTLEEHELMGHYRPEAPSLDEQLAARGWDLVGSCWVLRGVPNADGYIYIGNGNRRLTCARAGWEAWHGLVPGGHYVGTITACENRGRCIAPPHLVLRKIHRRVCARRGCTDPPSARDLCHRHFENQRAARTRRFGNADCLVPDCTDTQADHHGLCATHLTRAAQSGYLDLLPKVLASWTET